MAWPVSPRWSETARGSATVEVNIAAQRGGVVVEQSLPIVHGSASITVDGGSDVRRKLDLEVADPALRPSAWTDLLAPAGTELVATCGWRYPDGTTELVPVGVFRIEEPTTAFGGVVQVSGVDRSKLIADDRFLLPAQTITSNLVVTEIARIIHASLASAVVRDDTDDTTVCKSTSWEQGSSPWQAVKELALSIGAEVAADAAGVFVIRRVPRPTDPVVWDVGVGESGIVVSGSEAMTREGVHNAWTVRSDTATGATPVQATVYDLDPSSPTYWAGDFGHRPGTYSSPLLDSVAACQAAGTTLLARSTAPARQVSARVVPNPAWDYGDVGSLLLPDARSETHMIHRFTLPLDLGASDLVSVVFESSVPAVVA